MTTVAANGASGIALSAYADPFRIALRVRRIAGAIGCRPPELVAMARDQYLPTVAYAARQATRQSSGQFAASWLVKYLLEAGLDVNATVRDPSNKAKVGHFEQIAEQAAGTLLLHAFGAPMQGCEVVFHTASRFVVSGIVDPQAELVAPALQGNENVLDSVDCVGSVKRAAPTSSVASIHGDAADMTNAGIDPSTEAHWNTTSRVSSQPRSCFKRCAQRRAWAINAQQERW